MRSSELRRKSLCQIKTPLTSRASEHHVKSSFSLYPKKNLGNIVVDTTECLFFFEK